MLLSCNNRRSNKPALAYSVCFALHQDTLDCMPRTCSCSAARMPTITWPSTQNSLCGLVHTIIWHFFAYVFDCCLLQAKSAGVQVSNVSSVLGQVTAFLPNNGTAAVSAATQVYGATVQSLNAVAGEQRMGGLLACIRFAGYFVCMTEQDCV